VVQSIKDAGSDFFQNIFHGDVWALIAKIGATLVSRPAGIESAVVSQQFECDHLETVKDIHKDMENFIVEGFSKPSTEVGKSGLAGDVPQGKAGIGAVSSTFVWITEVLPKRGDIGVAIDISEQVNEKKSWRIVAGRSEFRVAVGSNGTDKAEVNEGSNHPGHTAPNCPIGADFHELFLEAVMR
jgi:hypothetical protein